jgi:uncharacterized protein YabE (DUF348 family)
VNNATSSAVDAPTELAAAEATSATTTTTRRRMRRLPLVAGLTAAALAVSGGAVAYADARKTVTLDVDGTVTTLSTFAGSVQGLLDDRGVRLGDHDVVTPAPGRSLAEGADVVVRYGRELTVQADGKQRTTWVTALDADEALNALADRGSDVALVASRSADRAELGLRLDAHGPVAVLADHKTHVVDNGRDGLDAVLAEAKVKLDGDDTVRILDLADAGLPAADRKAAAAQGAGVAVVVQRVVTKKVTKTRPVAFHTTTRKVDSLYKGESKVVRQGKDGERTIVQSVQTVDGQVTARKTVSNKVTTRPVTKIVAKGTKARPAAPKSSSASSGSSSSGVSMSGSPRAIGQRLAAARGWTGSQWTCLDNLFQRESGWNPHAMNPSSGAYGIPQALPGSKMGTVAGDWRTNPATQITWGLNYIASVYGTPCGAWGHSQATNWY